MHDASGFKPHWCRLNVAPVSTACTLIRPFAKLLSGLWTQIHPLRHCALARR